MKRKQLLTALLLMALFAPWAANAQETLTVYGDGTTTTNNYVPIYGLYCDEGVKCEFVIPAEQLEGMANGTISAMKFYLASVGYNTINPSFTIFVKEVDFTTMTAYSGTSGATTVFNSTFTFTTGTTNVEIEVPFSEDYTYEGGNLLIGVYQNGTSGYSSLGWTGVSQNYNSAWRGYGSSTGSAQQFLPKTTFTYTPGEAPSCPKPTNLTMSSIYSSAATISWESPANSFYFFYKKTTEEWPDYDPIEVNGRHDFTMAELEPNTTYDVRVKALCSVDPWEESPYATTQFTTDCGAITSFPWTEDFESYEANTIPSCWDNSASTTSTLSSNPERIWGVYSYSNNKMLRMYNYFVQSGTALINTMPFDIPVDGEYQLAFDYSHRANCGAFKVKISTDGGTTFTDLQSYTSTGSNEYTNPGTFTTAEPISLAAYAGQTVILQFYAEANYGSGAIFLDNVSISKVPTCLPPTGLQVAEVTAHSVRIEWDAEEGAMFQEDFNTMSFDPNTPPTNWNTQADYDNFATYSGLEPEHFYGIWVRKYCSEDDQSEPIYITFTTTEACPAPTGLHVVEGSITSTGASFAWDAEAGVTFQYYTISDPWEGFEPTEETSWTDTPNNTVGWPNAFPANSVTRFYLRKNCGDDGYSDNIYVEFRTLCGPISLINNYTEDFNDYTGVTSTTPPSGYPNDELPHCWQFLNRSETSSTYPMVFISSNSGYPVDGNCLFFKSSNTTHPLCHLA